jgi:hypothetical protein
MVAEKEITTVEKVYSPIFDKDIQKNISGSPIWGEAYHTDEISEVRKPLTEYTIKFKGLVPMQVTKMRKFVKK